MKEAAIVNQLPVYGVQNLRDVFGFFNQFTELQPFQFDTREAFNQHHDQYTF
jgi:magnesium chelatase family protein